MQSHPTDLAEVVLLEPRRFADHRGTFSEVYSRAAFAAATGLEVEFVQDNQSLSLQAGTVRGIHYQRPPMAQGKLVRVVRGAIFDVAVDLRAGSPTFGRSVGVELSAQNGLQLWVPVGFGHGFCTLMPNTEVVYKVTEYYSREDEGGLRWNDPALHIAWPVRAADAVLSEKDAVLPCLSEMSSPFTYGSP